MSDSASAVADMMQQNNMTEPANHELLPKNPHNSQINKQQPTNQQQNVEKKTRQIAQTIKMQKKKSSTPADLFYNLLLHNMKAKQAWQVAGCEFAVNSNIYKTITQRARRAIKAKQRAEETKIKEANMRREKRREQKLLQHKFLSVQQHRHEANRCLDALTVAQGEKRQMQKRIRSPTHVLTRARICTRTNTLTHALTHSCNRSLARQLTRTH